MASTRCRPKHKIAGFGARAHMTTFPIGSKVVCVNATLYGAVPGLIEGKTYTVAANELADGDIKVEGILVSLSPRRFELVKARRQWLWDEMWTRPIANLAEKLDQLKKKGII